MSKQQVPPAPNYQPLADAQLSIAADQKGLAQAQMAIAAEDRALAREQYEWAKQAYAENKGVTDQVVESFLATQAETTRNAQADRERYEDIFQPLEDDLAKDAQSYASEDRRELEMGRAQANVAQQFGAARVAAQRDLEAFGVNPGATRFAALDIGIRAQQAAAEAAAGNQASQMVDATGRALRSEAINVGRGYPGQVAGTYGTALQAGAQGNGQNLATTASGANTMGTGVQWGASANNANAGATGSYNGASNATSGAVSAMNTGYSNAAQQFKMNQENSSGWGSALGLVAGMGTKLAAANMSAGGSLLFEGGGAVEPPDGGAVPKQLSPSGGKAIDDVPARLNVGEFIVDADTVAFKGTEFFHKLKIKSREALAELENESGAVPTVHPGAMGAPQGGRRAALEVA